MRAGMRTSRAILILIATAVAVALTLGCEDPNAPGSKKPVDRADPPDPPAKAYAGTVRATVGTRMQATLRIADDGAFALSTLTAPTTASASVRRLETASAATTSTAAVLIALAGTATDDGTTATLQVASVKRYGVALEGAGLEKYKACSIAGTIGAGFHAAVLAAAASCVFAAGDVPVAPGDDTTMTPGGVTVTPVPADAKPIDVLIGKWGGGQFGGRGDRPHPQVDRPGFVWEFTADGLRTRDYYFRASGTLSEGGSYVYEMADTFHEYVDLVVTADAIVDMTLIKARICWPGYTCRDMGADLLKELLPFAYFLSGEVLTVVLGSQTVEMRRGYANPIPDMTFDIGDTAPRTFSLAGYFSGATSYSVRSDDSSVVTAALAGVALTITPIAPGSTLVWVTASKDRGSITVAFDATVR